MTEIIRAAVHQRISSLEADRRRIQQEVRDAHYAEESAWQDASEAMVDRPPASVAALIAAFEQVPCGNITFDWTPNTTDTGALPVNVTLVVDWLGRRGEAPKIGLLGEVRVAFVLGPVPDDIRDKMLAYNVAAWEKVAREAELRAIQEQLNDRQLRERLEGELISQVVAQQLPAIGTMLEGLANDRSTLRLIGG